MAELSTETVKTASIVPEATPESKGAEKSLETGKTAVKGDDVKTSDPVKIESKKYKVKVEGKEVEVPEDELVRGYSHATAANKKFQEAATMRKQAEEFIGLLKTDPLKVLKDPRIGHDVRKLAEEYLIAEMEKEAMTPDQRELADAREKLKVAEEEKKANAKVKEDAQNAELTKKFTDDYTNDILGALKGSGLPQTEHTVRRMAYYMYQALNRGYELKAADIIPLVKEDYKAESKALFDQLDGQTLLEILGDNTAKKIADYNLSKIKTTGKKVLPEEQGQRIDAEPQVKKLTKEEWRAKLDRI